MWFIPSKTLILVQYAYPNGHCFCYSEIRNFTVLYERYANVNSFFFSEIQSFTVVRKWQSVFVLFAFLQRNTKFCCFTQTVVSFYRKMPDFENYSHTVIAWIKHLDIFPLFSTISLRHKWNGTRLVSPKNESTSCRTTSPISGLTALKRKKRLSFDYEVRNF